MIVCIRLTQFSILAIFIISLLLCIGISSITTITDPTDENSVPSRTESTDEGNQTAPIDDTTPPLNENAVPETNADLQSTEIPSIVENEIPLATDQSELVDEVISTTTTPLVTDSPTHDEPSVTTTPTITTTKKNLSSINSFEEWKQQQLHADLLTKGEIASRNSVSPETAFANVAKGTSSTANIQQNPSSTNSNKKGKLRKNFASASCGAKILAHNVESQNVGSVLSSSPDEYMLNPCNAKIWFVIELCESIRILNIEIANFELFSSVPKTFRVSAADRYPTKDWHRHHLGTFNASFNRTIQSFQTTESTTYLKYVKFELLDFHGHEHYCPLSVVRIHGSNVEDEIMTMEDNTNSVELKSISNMEEENDDDGTDDEDLANEQQVGGIIGSAILDLAKRVFRRQTIRGTSSTTSSPVIETNGLKSDCHQAVLNGSVTNETIYIWRRSETLKECIAKFLVGLWGRFDTCTAYLSQICFKINRCCQCPITINNRTKAKRSTLNIYNNPCGYYHILTSQFVCPKKKLIPVNQTILAKINGDLAQDLMEKTLPVEHNETGTVTNESGNSSDSQSVSNLSESILDEIPHESTTNRSGDLSPAQNVSNETITMSESPDTLETTDESSPSSSSSPLISESIPENFTVTEPSIETNNIEETSTTTTTTTPSTLTSSNSNEVMPPIISSPWIKGLLVNTKSLPELFKIIEKLSFNLTLSNRYLQELSQHYVKKIDETQETTDLLLKSSKRANEKLENLEEQFNQLQENFNDMSYRLIKLEAWIPLIVCSIMCLFIWCLWSTCRLIHLRRKHQHLADEFEQMKSVQQLAKNHDESEDDGDDEDDTYDRPIICNGYNKRKLSTDSSDSNPTRSQRVPDVSLSKIVENGTGKHNHQFQEKSSKRMEQFPSLTAIQT